MLILPFFLDSQDSNSQGKLFIALILDVMLFGINIMQTYFYYIHSKKDRLWIKISVVVIFLADFLQPLFLSIYLYRTLIVHFGNETAISTATSLFAVVPTVTVSIDILLLNLTSKKTTPRKGFNGQYGPNFHNWYYAVFIIAAAVSATVCIIAIAFEGAINPQFLDFRAFKVVAIISFVSEMLGDIMITSILVWSLVRHRDLVSDLDCVN